MIQIFISKFIPVKIGGHVHRYEVKLQNENPLYSVLFDMQIPPLRQLEFFKISLKANLRMKDTKSTYGLGLHGLLGETKKIILLEKN